MTMRVPVRSLRIKGFSLIELLASVAILALLATVALPLAQTTIRRDKEMDFRHSLRELRQALDAYKAATSDGRIAQAPDQSGYPADLNVLTAGVNNGLKPGGAKLYFLRRIPRDPFFADTAVSAAQTWGLRSFDSPPERPRTGVDVFDVYSRSDQVGLNGIAYKDW